MTTKIAGNKKASVEYSQYCYIVDLYIDNKLHSKSMVQSIYEAEEIMGNFLGESSSEPQFLKESE